MAIRENIYWHGTSIILLLRDIASFSGLSASSRLTGLKGSSDPAQRDGMSLRSELGALNRFSVSCTVLSGRWTSSAG